MDEKIYAKEVKKILDDYFVRLKSKIKNLPRSEQQDILDEIRSDILAELHQGERGDSNKQKELLFSILAKLGKPEEVANEILSKRLFSFRGNFVKRFCVFTSRSFLKALIGFVISVINFLLYLVGFLNLAMAGLKVFMPDKIGLFVSEKGFAGYGFKMGSYDIALWSTTSIKGEEILGYWIILLGIIFFFIFVSFANFINLKLRNIWT